MKLTACGRTDVGLLRKNNEDCCFVAGQLGLFIVADGMGGHAAGEIASEMATRVVREQLSPLLLDRGKQEDLETALPDAIRQANHTLTHAAADNPAWRGMGTTLTVLVLQASQALLGHVGDSRLYRWRGGILEQLSDDHSLIGDQMRRGIITAAEADISNLRNILLQAVGISPDLDICLKQFPLVEGDCFLLCSDGLTGMLSDREIAGILERDPVLENACAALIEKALAAGGSDNITAILVRVENF